MVNPLQRYKNISVLVLDDFSEFRLSLKQMLESFGAEHIDVCTNAQEALALYSEHKHDIVLVDYNLGDGLNGLQLLAELNHRNLLRYGTSYVLITGETALDLVMGALEFRPDDYLAKPFTKTTLKSRLDKLVERSLAFSSVHSALNNEKPNRALSLCDELMQSHKRLSLHCLRLKADIYLKQLNYAKALNIYNSILSSRELSWAQMGAAICLLALSHSDKAYALCQQIISKNPNAVEAYDLACECLIQQQDYETAYALTQDASQRSPNSIIRQRLLASLATRYHEYDVAFSANKKLLGLAKHSCLSQIDDYINQLLICSEFQLTPATASARKAAKEFSNLYRALTKHHPGKQVQLVAELHQAFINYLKTSDNGNQTAFINAAKEIEQYPDPFQPAIVKLLEFIYEHAHLDDVKHWLSPVVEKDKAELITHDDQQKSDSFNRQGMVKYKDKDFDAAQSAFSTALVNAPNNPNIALNLLQSCYQLYKQKNLVTINKRHYILCAQALKTLSPQDHRYKQSQSLLSFAKSKITG